MGFNIEELVNRQVLKWQEGRRAAERSAKQAEADRQLPMITMSRQFGARGAEIGHVVAEQLGFHYYSQEVVQQIAEKAHVRTTVIESVDERIQDAIDNWIGDQFGGEVLAHSDYLKNLAAVVLTMGRHGRGVIVGRGANYILDPRKTLRVRAFAPIEARIERIAEAEGIPRHEARARVLRVDAERAAFCKQHFDRDIESVDDFDLLLNTGSIPIAASAGIVVNAFKSRFPSAAG